MEAIELEQLMKELKNKSLSPAKKKYLLGRLKISMAKARLTKRHYRKTQKGNFHNVGAFVPTPNVTSAEIIVKPTILVNLEEVEKQPEQIMVSNDNGGIVSNFLSNVKQTLFGNENEIGPSPDADPSEYIDTARLEINLNESDDEDVFENKEDEKEFVESKNDAINVPLDNRLSSSVIPYPSIEDLVSKVSSMLPNFITGVGDVPEAQSRLGNVPETGHSINSRSETQRYINPTPDPMDDPEVKDQILDEMLDQANKTNAGFLNKISNLISYLPGFEAYSTEEKALRGTEEYNVEPPKDETSLQQVEANNPLEAQAEPQADDPNDGNNPNNQFQGSPNVDAQGFPNVDDIPS